MAYKKSKFQPKPKQQASAKQEPRISAKEQAARQRAASQVRNREAGALRRAESTPIQVFEAAIGSGEKLAKFLVEKGTYKSPTAAKNAIRSKKLNEESLKLLGKQVPYVEQEALAKYEEKKTAQQARARITTKLRESLAPSKKAMLASIDPDNPRNNWAAGPLKNAKVKAVSSDGIMRFGDRKDGDFVRLYGITKNYHKGDQEETFVVHLPLYAEVEGVRRETFPGWSNMTFDEQAAKLAAHYHSLTQKNGELGAIQFITKKQHEETKKKRNG